jgi:UDP-N-acetylmuramoyl-tripeptide--D-alanyl-D-alanine ligase
VAVVTTVGASHLELLGTVEAVAAAKTELVAPLDESGVAVLNIDDPRVAAMAQATPGRVVGYGRSAGADWRAEEVALDHLARPSFRVRGEPVRLPMPGAHNVGNALAALAVADVCGVSTASAAAALATASVSKWRMELGESPEGVVVFNDAYNANPDSAAVGLETLAAADVAGRRWAVLGEMAELGEGTAEAHAELGRRCAAGGVDGLVAVGGVAAELAEGAHTAGFAGAEGVEVVDNPDAALRVLSGRVGAGDAVLVKASRRSGLERVAAGLMNGLMAGKAEGGA